MLGMTQTAFIAAAAEEKALRVFKGETGDQGAPLPTVLDQAELDRRLANTATREEVAELRDKVAEMNRLVAEMAERDTWARLEPEKKTMWRRLTGG